MKEQRQCRAFSKRSRKRCKNWALRGKKVCRFHGGKSTGPNKLEGRERIAKAHFRHGLYSKAHQEYLSNIKNFIHESKLLISESN